MRAIRKMHRHAEDEKTPFGLWKTEGGSDHRNGGQACLCVPCHNCIAQVRDLAKEYELDIKAVHFKEIISEHMVISEEMLPKDDDEEAIEPAASE